MAEGENEKRPVRKLTVKNFSVIKEAELEFGKITVLIGPQASGKSLLCKLAFFFSQYLPEFVHNAASRFLPIDELMEAARRRFTECFPLNTWSGDDTEITYCADSYSVSVEIAALQLTPVLRFDFEFLDAYDKWRESCGKASIPGELLPSNGSVFIPSGRSFFSTPNKGFVSVSEKNLDWITQRFSTEMDFEYRAMIASFGDTGDPLHEFGTISGNLLRGQVVNLNGVPHFQSAPDNRISPFSVLSSGTLELLPLLNLLSQRTLIAKYLMEVGGPSPSRGPIFVEEPESGIFPSSQYELMRLFVWLANRTDLDISFTITTHSPYILTSFNNLIEAGQAARNHPDAHDQVAKIIPEQYWIKEGDFRAYSIHEGKLESILNESGFIEGNYLDQVSEVIGNEFDQLLRLEYDHTEAS